MMAFTERDLTSDARRAGHGLGRPGPGPGWLPPICDDNAGRTSARVET